MQIHPSLQVARKNRCWTSKRSAGEPDWVPSSFAALIIVWHVDGTAVKSSPLSKLSGFSIIHNTDLLMQKPCFPDVATESSLASFTIPKVLCSGGVWQIPSLTAAVRAGQ